MPKKSAPKKKVTKKVSQTRNTSQTPSLVLSEHMKHTIITALLLVFAYPIGLLVMFTWTKWPTWLKWMIAIPMAAFFISVILPALVLIFIGLHIVKEYKEDNRLVNPTPVVTQVSPTPTPTLAPSQKKVTY
jgi:hypothetical protein